MYDYNASITYYKYNISITYLQVFVCIRQVLRIL